MKKIFHLSTCNTCQKIIKELGNGDGFELQDIKQKNISANELDAAAKYLGGYEALFSKKAMKYRSLGLNEQSLTENDFREWILKEYTFLKRPVIQVDGEYFAGNAKATIGMVKSKIF
jgi:arsenate reductase (glutaredoxin)